MVSLYIIYLLCFTLYKTCEFVRFGASLSCQMMPGHGSLTIFSDMFKSNVELKVWTTTPSCLAILSQCVFISWLQKGVVKGPYVHSLYVADLWPDAFQVAVAQKAPLEQRHAVCATISTAVALLDFNMNTYAFEASQVTSAFPISVDSAEANFPVLPSAKVGWTESSPRSFPAPLKVHQKTEAFFGFFQHFAAHGHRWFWSSRPCQCLQLELVPWQTGWLKVGCEAKRKPSKLIWAKYFFSSQNKHLSRIQVVV